MPSKQAGEDVVYCKTSRLDIAYKRGGKKGGVPVLLMHGWPDDASTFDRVAPSLQRAGCETFTPWLRGFGPTRFGSNDACRSGEIAALAQDALDLADALGLERFAIIGHDWGARIAYLLSSVYPERIVCSAALSVAWDPGEPVVPPFEQAKAYWYQWFLATQLGEDTVRNRAKDFARFQWDSWSPTGWFDDDVFNEVAQSFENPAWPDVTLHSYRVRWGQAEPDARYAELAKRQRSARVISVPTMMIQGGEDRCLLPSTSLGKEQHFTGFYERVVLDGVGHFPTREAPDVTSKCLLGWLTKHAHV
jgi:pimeloyl-ACP methyl ester carboxylesterase